MKGGEKRGRSGAGRKPERDRIIMNVRANTVLMNTPFGGIDKMNEVYFIGIGGIGMSAIARFFHAGGVRVSGYDKTPTVLTKELEASGIPVHYEEKVERVPKEVDLVVYTPARPP
jgi:UDP-N-acetylmuramate--alanine ligase